MQSHRDVLILEDDRRVCQILSEQLEKDFEVHLCNRVFEAEHKLKHKHIDLICSDLILPDGNGIDFCKQVRKEFPEIKIIVLTKRTSIDARLSCFEIGADDYLPKPFYPEELHARISTLLKRGTATDGKLRYKNLALDLSSNMFSHENSTVIVSLTERLLLESLIINPQLKSLETIAKYISTKRKDNISEKALRVVVARLRNKLERNWGMRIIKTRYGSGYYIGL